MLLHLRRSIIAIVIMTALLRIHLPVGRNGPFPVVVQP